MSIFEMGRKAKQFYPKSKYMRRQWVEKTLWLRKNDKHVLYKEKASV